METNYSHKTSNTKLFKERKNLNLEFVYETSEAAFFGLEHEDQLYWLIETFESGEILVSDEEGSVLDNGLRILNLLRLKI